MVLPGHGRCVSSLHQVTLFCSLAFLQSVTVLLPRCSKRLTFEPADCGLLSADAAAGIRHVKWLKKLGVRLGNWLTAVQAITLWKAPTGATLKDNVTGLFLDYCWPVVLGDMRR